MGALSKFRKWINRDDGRLYQVGNGPIGALATIGGLALVASLVLWQLHDQIGINSIWAISTGVFGLVFFMVGYKPGRDGGDEF